MRRWLRRPVVWVPISAVLLAFVAWRSRIWEAGAVLGSPQPAPLVVAVLLNGAIAVLWAIRSSDLLGATGHPVGIGPLVPMTAFANTINNLTPGSAGEVFRAWLLRASHGVPYAAGSAVIVIERVVALGYMAASAAVIWFGYTLGIPAAVQLVLLVLVAASPGIVYALGIRPAGAFGRLPLGGLVGPERWVRAGSVLSRVDGTIAGLLTRPRHLVVFALTTALIFTCYTAQLCLVAASVGITLDPLAAWGALGLATIAGVLSLLPFGLGATDVVMAALLVAVGVPASAAGPITFGYRLVATLPLGIMGTLSYAWLSVRLPSGGSRAVMEAVSAGMADEQADEAS